MVLAVPVHSERSQRPSVESSYTMESSVYPRTEVRPGHFRVLWKEESPSQKTVAARFILDFDWNQVVIGIEILNLRLYVGPNCIKYLQKYRPPERGPFHFAYDEEADAFSVTISHGSSSEQRAVDGSIITEADGSLVGLDAKLM